MHNLERVRLLMSTGAVLHDKQFDWVALSVGALPIQSISGGTDIIGCFVLGSPLLPVYRGELQCRSLGLDVQALTGVAGARGGELVCCNPFPSRPIGFFGDPTGQEFHAAYFAANEGVWTHGDLVEFTPRGSARILGRSDGVLNVGGVRIGPADIYAVVMRLDGVRQAMAVEQCLPAGGALPSRVVLLLVMERDGQLDDAFQHRIRRALARDASPAHVPALIVEVADLPRTYSGKPSEAAVRAALDGRPVANVEALINPDCLRRIVDAVVLADAHPALANAGSPCSDDVAVDQLCAIFTTVMQGGPIGPDDNFLDLGGSSLMIAHLCQAIYRELGYDIPMSSVFSHPTPSELVHYIRTASSDEESVASLKSGSADLPPVFVVHDVSGDVLAYLQLAKLLPGPRSIVGVRARGLHAASSRDLRIQSMAESAIDAVRLVQATGPFTLVGYSFGGLVAYEMARRLTTAGEKVAEVVLIDSHLGTGCLSARERARFMLLQRPLQWANRIWTGGKAEVCRLLQRNLEVATAWFSGHDARSRYRLPPTPLREAVAAIARSELSRYRPPQYPGRVTLVRSSRPLPSMCDPTPIWRRAVSGELSVVTLQGSHFDLVALPMVRELARIIATLPTYDTGEVNVPLTT